MGRPLFSQPYVTAPVVRSEPEPGVTPYEKWTRWNCFDPDADEFFESEHAVYEAFIDPVPHSSQEGEDMVVTLVEREYSQSSSEGSGSESGSPMAVGSDDPASMLAEVYASANWEGRFLAQPLAFVSEAQSASDATATPFFASVTGAMSRNAELSNGARAGRQRSATINIMTNVRVPDVRQGSNAIPTSNAADIVPRTLNITPINIPTPRTEIFEPASGSSPLPPLPSTPPSQRRAPQVAPSPAPSVSPRINSWSRPVMPPSPSPTAPLPNRSARMSLAHIHPIIVRARDLAT
jgi:hypothetical protein